MILGKAQPKFHGVDAPLMRQLIQEALVGNTRVGVANRAPLLGNDAFLGRVVAATTQAQILVWTSGLGLVSFKIVAAL